MAFCWGVVMVQADVKVDGDSWRSSLYPEDWRPGYTDTEGRFLHDFSYAGYHYGEEPPREVAGPVLDVTQAPYHADSSGEEDATAAIQQALDDAGSAGGGVVYLPAGTYRIVPPEGAEATLRIQENGVVLRGAGAGKTYLFNDQINMRQKTVIDVMPREETSWNADGIDVPGILLAQDMPQPVSVIPLENVAGLQVGDAVVIRNDLTQHYIDLVGMHGKWEPTQSPNRTLTYYRRITAIDPVAKTISIDTPTRGYLYRADNARIVPVAGAMLQEVGLEDFSIGMRQQPGEGLEMRDFAKEGTIGHAVHASKAIKLSFVENAWVRGVQTYAPEGNDPNIHVVSGALKLWRSRLVTVMDCDFRYPQYEGEGGNGYLYTMQGQDNLVRDCYAESGRHNYSFGTMSASGNVIFNCVAKDGRLAADFHMFLSLANLIDNMTCDGDFIEARALRPWGGKVMHGVTTTESVFWNTNGLRYSEERPVLIYSHQQGDGYVIGTRGPADTVDSSDFVEGVGQGDTLRPQSLYADQLQRRLQPN